METINAGTFNISLFDLDKRDQKKLSKVYNDSHHNWSENYYSDPKVTHPSIKIDVLIPKDWTSSSYKNDVCPSFTHKGLQIFVCDDKTKKLEELHTKYSVMYEKDYGCGHDDLLLSDDWHEVIKFVSKFKEKK
tara:strand:+ start:167 stop:565 length:399 start_codon:yes stop_codon:yes gene_type:complete